MDIRICIECGNAVAPPHVRCPGCGSAVELHDETWLLGQTLGNYKIERVLGSGGMGVVFGARHLKLLREAAVKVLQPGLGREGESGVSDADAYERRFLREARLLASLEHPGIIGIYDFDVSPIGFPYLVMPLLRGETLRQLLERHRQGLPAAWVAAILADLGSALMHAHGQQVVHRDLKPDNVFLVAGEEGVRACLLDFGIAYGGQHEAMDVTASGVLMGTPRYLAPEQLRGEAITPATDQYSLALLAIELLAGRAVRAGQSLTEIIRRYAAESLPEAALPDTLEPAQRDAFLRATDPDPSRRFPDVATFVRALALPEADRDGLAAAVRVPPERLEDPALATAVVPITPPARASAAKRSAPADSAPRSGLRARGVIGALLLVALAAMLWWWLSPRAPVVPATPGAGADAPVVSRDSAAWLRPLDRVAVPGALAVLAQVDDNLILRQAAGWVVHDLATGASSPVVALAREERLLGTSDEGALLLLHDGLLDALDPRNGQRRVLAGPDPALRGGDQVQWAASGDGHWLARIDTGQLQILARTGERIHPRATGSLPGTARLAFGSDTLFTASPRGQLQAWDLATGQPRWQLPLPVFRVHALAVDEGIGYLALATDEGVQIRDLAHGELRQTLSHRAEHLLWFGDGHLAESGNDRTTLWQWREGGFREQQRLAFGGPLFRGDEHLFVLADGQLQRLAFGPTRVPASSGLGEIWTAVADAGHFYLSGRNAAIVRLAPDEPVLQRQVHEAGVTDLVIHEGRLISASDDRTLAVWTLPGLDLQWRAKGHDFLVNQIAFGASLWSASSDGSLRRWHWPELEPAEDLALAERLSAPVELHALWVAPDDAEILVGTWNRRLLRLRRQGADWAIDGVDIASRAGYRLIDLPALQAVLVLGLFPARLAVYDRLSGQLSELPPDTHTWYAAAADGSGAGAWLGGRAELARIELARVADGRFEFRTRLSLGSDFGVIGAMAARPAQAGQPPQLLLGNDAGAAFLLSAPASDGPVPGRHSLPPRDFTPIR